MRALKYPNDVIEDVTKLVYLHLRIHTYAMGWTDKAVRRYVRDAGDLLDELNHLQRCDCTTRNQQRARALQRRMDELEARIVELRGQEELDSIRPPLDGRQVMELPGREARPGRGRGARLPARGAPRRRADRRGRRLRASRGLGTRTRHRTRRRRARGYLTDEIRRLPCGRATRSSSAPALRGRRAWAPRWCRRGTRRGRAR